MSSSQQLEECIGNHPPQKRRQHLGRSASYQHKSYFEERKSQILLQITNPTSKNAKHLGTTLTKRASRLQSRIFYYWHDHIQVVNQLLEKVKEYKIPLCFASVDDKKAFDSTEFTALFKALENKGVDLAYITILRDSLFWNSTGTVTKSSWRRGFKTGWQ